MNKEDREAFDEALASMSGGFEIYSKHSIAEAFFQAGLEYLRSKQKNSVA